MFNFNIIVLGAALFAKRKQKSEKWIVDENSYKQKTAAAAAAAASAATPVATPSAPPPVEVTPLSTVAAPNRQVEQSQKIASVQVTNPKLCLIWNRHKNSNIFGIFHLISSKFWSIKDNHGYLSEHKKFTS